MKEEYYKVSDENDKKPEDDIVILRKDMLYDEFIECELAMNSTESSWIKLEYDFMFRPSSKSSTIPIKITDVCWYCMN